MNNLHYNLTVQFFTRDKCFGPGIARLLTLVREHHSLRAAAAEMGMAYSKAWRIVRQCETALGFPLLDSTTGGKNGGGAVLTREGEQILSDYCRFRQALTESADRLFQEHLGSWLRDD